MVYKKIIHILPWFLVVLLALVAYSGNSRDTNVEVTLPDSQEHVSLVADSAKLHNLWAGANAYAIYKADEHERLQVLDAMQRAQLSVLRIFLTRGFEEPIGTYHEQQLEKVDRLMEECQARGIELLIAFDTHLDSLYTKTYGPVDMYKDEKAIEAYKERITYFLNHRNPYLENKAWKDLNNVVFAWQIQNEPGTPLLDRMLSKYHDEALLERGSRYATSLEEAFAMVSDEKHDMMRSYLNQIASHIKEVDPDTMVALGTAGDSHYYHENGGRGDDLRTLGNIEDADIYTLHFYGGRLDVWLDEHLEYVRDMGKILFIEEFVYKGEGITYEEQYDFFQTVTRLCRLIGVPWMIWQFGLVPEGEHPKWYLKGDIREETAFWQDIIVPEASAISRQVTFDPWNVKKVDSKLPFQRSRTLVSESVRLE